MRRTYDDFRVTGFVRPVERGAVKIDTIVPAPTREAAAFFVLKREGRVDVGETYTRLYVKNRLVMSDTPDEHLDHIEAIQQAHGRVLIHGLGLGCYLKAILAKPNVEHVDVVEINEDVIEAVGPYYAGRKRFVCDRCGQVDAPALPTGDQIFCCGMKMRSEPRVTIHHADALTREWPKGMRWDVVWHDIWTDKSVDDIPTRSRLNRRFGRRAGWQGAWAQDFVRYMQRAWA